VRLRLKLCTLRLCVVTAVSIEEDRLAVRGPW